MKILRSAVCLSTLLTLLACGTEPPPEDAPETMGPGAVFSALEERLVRARRVQIQFHVVAQGAVEADLEGRLTVNRNGATLLEAEGGFAGDSVGLFLATDGETFEFGARPDLERGPTPAHLNEALFIGFTRMGILHNLARLVGDAPPDGAEGGVRDWVIVDSISAGVAGENTGESGALTFSMIVGGTPVGTASLTIGEDGLPKVRRQTVRFPNGEMHVVETYFAVVIDP